MRLRPRPHWLPHRIPKWAWKRLRLPGHRPKVGPNHLPAWFWVWREWRLGLKIHHVPVPTKRQRVVGWAKWAAAQPGASTSYLFGGPPGIGAGSHTDCSGFCVAVFQKVGVNLPRTSEAQYASTPVRPTRDRLRPGDLVFFNYEGPQSHVGIYTGGGMMIDDEHTGSGIKKDPVDWTHFDGAASYLP